MNEKELLVKKSSIPASGKGLFTKKMIAKGTRITEYKGKIRTWKEAKAGKADNRYILFVNWNHVIDAMPFKKSKARFANDAMGLTRIKGLTNNSIYVKDGVRVFIESAKKIPAGSEILVSYGQEYWESIRYNNNL